ncbi:hypothetical protein SAMN00777080_3422 [Aquiflexum balticum DSM 16537]|uniref:Terpene synthase n=1 Tax=Aquiflexum balticum DSM 16537 TaxID=758820 RepID=A0A1W2H825_9BACT|nr:terpene synthase family protein [Aquiflexum balticum]SMD44788.1 hypothetical protein SAMN00777080_3422 [Aquiflexum balticum DSM 16537]
METINKPTITNQTEFKVLNPYYKIVDFEVNKWAEELNLFENEEEKIISKNQHLNKFTSRLYPNANLKELLPISKLILVLFLADDRADRFHGKGKIDFWKNLLSDFEQGTNNGQGIVWGMIFSEISLIHCNHNLSSIALAGKNFRNLVRNFIKAGIWESENLFANNPPLPNEYLKKLKHSSGAEIAIHFLTHIQSNKIDLGTLYSPELKQLRKTLLLIICLSNDLASFSKEECSGDFHNLVLLYEIHFKLNRKESIARVIEKLNLLKKKYLSLLKQVQKNPGICPEKKISICDSFNGLLLGCEIWAKEDTGRYVGVVTISNEIEL